MYAILKRELRTNLGSLTGMVVSLLFLTITGLFLWIFPDSNILDSGYASLQPFFDLAPWTFLFLIPATTMRLFSEEKKNGTLEIILTKPIRDWELILGKYFSVMVLFSFALLPTVFYYLTIVRLGLPIGNIDHGAVLGSYLGLIFLGSCFSSIGLFCSSITSNQIIAFLVGGAGCFFFFTGFDSFSKLPFLSSLDQTIQTMGIRYHYDSISRGVLDTRDLLYFLSVSALFLYFTKLNMESRKW
jgi:ABC-2 type transport system permease protein